jgi:hypothetical protein
MACNCNSSTSTPCASTPNCEGCEYTMNADCVIYNGDRLAIEPDTITDNSSRTLSSILELMSNCCSKPSKLITGDYTVVAGDDNYTLLLKGFDDGEEGTLTYTITLPDDVDELLEKELVFKNISVPLDSEVTTIVWVFAEAIQYIWVPTTSTTAYATLDDTHGVLRLRLVKVSSTTYQWLVV